MACNKLPSFAVACVVIGVAVSPVGAHADPGASYGKPPIGAPLQKYLSRIARRTIRDALLQRQAYHPDYVPSALKTVNGEAVVRLWRDGFLQATGVGGPGPVVYCVTRAASVAAASLKQGKREVSASDASEMTLEVEIAGKPVALSFDGDWTQPGALSGVVEPGVDGLIVTGKFKGRRVYPSELIWRGLALHEALTGLAKATQSDPTNRGATKLARFTTVHWVQDQSGADTQELIRGMVLQRGDSMALEGLSEAIDALTEYVLYRQRPDGLFSYEFHPGANRYVESDDLLHQLGATAALAQCANLTGRETVRAAVDLSLRFHRRGLQTIPGLDGAAFLATADQSNPLGATALLSLALTVHPRPQEYAAVREQLVVGILSLQRKSGMFLTAFPPAVTLNQQDYFPGEALFALASQYAVSPSPRVLGAFDRALGFYRDYFRANRSPAFLAWQVRAFSLMAKQTNRRDFAEFAFELADAIAAAQLDASNSRWPALYGGVRFGSNDRPGASTSMYLAALCDAVRVARMIGDHERAARYLGFIRAATRFVIQLQFRKAEAFFVKSPQDAVGGIRTSPSLNRLRIDHAVHALAALLMARRVLYTS